MARRRYYRRRFYRRRRYYRRRVGKKVGGSNLYLDLQFQITGKIGVSGQGQGYRFEVPNGGAWASNLSLTTLFDYNTKWGNFAAFYEKFKVVGVSIKCQPLINGANHWRVQPTALLFSNTSENNQPPLDNFLAFSEYPGAIMMNPTGNTYHYWKVNSEYVTPQRILNGWDPAFMILSMGPAGQEWQDYQVYQYTFKIYIRFKGPKV